MSTAQGDQYTPQCLIFTLFLSKLPASNFSNNKISLALAIENIKNVQFPIKLALQRLRTNYEYFMQVFFSEVQMVVFKKARGGVLLEFLSFDSFDMETLVSLKGPI